MKPTILAVLGVRHSSLRRWHSNRRCRQSASVGMPRSLPSLIGYRSIIGVTTRAEKSADAAAENARQTDVRC